MKRVLLLSFCLIGIALPSLVWAIPSPIANAPLVNQEGKPFQVHDLKGSYLFVSFVFSRCPMPKMCPLTMTKSQQVLRAWNEAKMPVSLKVVAVTLDPEFDTPAVLKSLGKAHNVDFSGFTLATGNTQAVNSFAESFNVMAFPGGGTLSHNSKSILIGPDLMEIAEYEDNEFTAKQVLADARKK